MILTVIYNLNFSQPRREAVVISLHFKESVFFVGLRFYVVLEMVFLVWLKGGGAILCYLLLFCLFWGCVQ